MRHPEPGEPYKGGKFVALLPDTAEGQESLRLFRYAFAQRLLFRVVPRGGRDGYKVDWDGVPVKDARVGGGVAGWPDAGYFDALRRVLGKRGIV